MADGNKVPPVLVIGPDEAPDPGYPAAGLPPDRPCLVRDGLRRDEVLRMVAPWVRYGVPWVVQTCDDGAESFIRSGAWAVLPAGLPGDVAAAFTAGLHSRISMAREENPLTGLPGNSRIASVISTSMREGRWSVAYIDIVDFKPFNDYYGFARGDAVIRTLSEILVEQAGGAFVGHIGGDDFVCAGPGTELEARLDSARESFRSRAPAFYAERDRDLGGIETLDRHGRFRFFPFLDICVVLLDPREASSVEDLARRAGIAKKARKGDLVPGSLSDILWNAPGERQTGEGPRADVMDPGTLGWMARMDSGSSDHSDIKAVIEAAGISGDRRVSGLLEEILAGDFPFGLRKSAALSLGSLACPDSVGILRDSLSDPSPHVRTRAVEALALSVDRASSELIEARTRDSSTWVRRAALKAVGAVRTPNALRILLERVRNGEAASRNGRAERAAALDGLALLADPAAMILLSELVKDPSFEPAESLWKAIASSGGGDGVSLICREAPQNSNAAMALQWINPSALSGPALERIEETACALLGVEGAWIPALRCLSGLPGQGGRRLEASMERLAMEAEGYGFGLVVTVMEKRGLHPGRALLREAADALEKGSKNRSIEDLVAMTRLAAREGVNPGALLPLLRSRRREISLAAARAILQTAGTRLSGKPAAVEDCEHGTS